MMRFEADCLKAIARCIPDEISAERGVIVSDHFLTLRLFFLNCFSILLVLSPFSPFFLSNPPQVQEVIFAVSDGLSKMYPLVHLQ